VTGQAFGVRGIVEGFYGPPWSHDARLEMLTFLAAHEMNAYAYAPKDDAKHRAGWRVPYTVEELQRFKELAARADDVGVRFGFAVSPGLDITYDADDDRSILLSKLLGLADVGVSWFLLLLDDIPLQPGLAPRQADLATALLESLTARVPEVTMTVCPTEYVGMQSSPYLTDLAAGLPAAVDVMWTGPTVCSPTITAADARARAAALGGRPPLVWDNFPVNDATMTASLHLGPYLGRDPELASVTSGVLCNPMVQPRASKIALGTAAAFLARPTSYDPQAAWTAAIADTGAAHAEPLAVLARACADSALLHPRALDIVARVRTIEDAIDGPDWMLPVRELASDLRAARALPGAFADDEALAAEVAPWADAARVEAEAGLAALRLLQQIRPVATVTDGRGRAAAPDADAAMQHAFVLMFTWKTARANERVVFGPRFALYTPVVQLAGGLPGLDVKQAVREDENAIDALCRLALHAYDEWCRDAGATVTVVVDRDERQRDADGTFDAHGTVIVLRAGDHATRVDAPAPFRDRRLP
jgi:hyaluronoglucosaminidase